MRHIRITVLFLIVLFYLPRIGHTQYNRKLGNRVETGNFLFGLQVGIPTRDMQEAVKNKMGNTGFGLGICGLTNPMSWGRNKHDSPLRIGAELGYTYYGRFLSEVNINGSSGSYKTSYGIVQANGIIQLRPAHPQKFTPFIDLLAGGSFYLSTTKENLNAIESSLGITSFDFGGYSSASFNKGLAVGCVFGKKNIDEARFTLRVSYTTGNDIKYVIRNSLTYDPSSGGLVYYVGKAPLKYFMVQIGIGI